MGRIDDELDAQCRRVAADTVEMIEQLRLLANRVGTQSVASDEHDTWLDGYLHAHMMRSIEDADTALRDLLTRIVPEDEARRMLNLPQR